MTNGAEVPEQILTKVRAACLALPESYEEPAWVGVRWRIRTKTFAHLLTIDDGKPQAHATAATTSGPVTVMTFRAPDEELDMFRHAGHPYFHGGWGRDVVGLLFDDATDWEEVAELLTESYCVLAPKKLVDQVVRPGGAPSP